MIQHNAKNTSPVLLTNQKTAPLVYYLVVPFFGLKDELLTYRLTTYNQRSLIDIFMNEKEEN